MPRHSITDDGNDNVSIDLSPMIDCVFILLIFFIVTTVFVEETGIDVHKPEAANSVALDKQSIQIAISADNKIYYGGNQIDVGSIGTRVKSQLLKEKVPVNIQADRGSSHGVFSAVYDQVKNAGAEDINFSTEN